MEFILFPLTAGIASSFAHCIAMCGPLQLALRTRVDGTAALLTYHLGRTLSYALMGLLTGFLGFLIHGRQIPSLMLGAKIFIIILFLVFAAGLWGIGKFDLDALAAGAAASEWFKRISAKAFHQSIFAAGMVNGLLPCPTTYAVLGWTLSLDSALKGAFSMTLLGIVTLPSFILMWYSLAFKKLWTGSALKKVFALLFLGLAIWKTYQLFTMGTTACCPNMMH